MSVKLREASIASNVIFGENVTVITPSNLYGCVIHDDVFVGPFVEIQSDVVIGKRTRVQSHSFICSLVNIGKDCVIGHGVMFINDTFATGGPARGDQQLWKKTKVDDNVSIGSNATILPVTICANVVIGAGAVVVSDIETSGIYAGCPARKIRDL
ncbi:DapH/DapD/GlmU-related protein [Halodesulfovibrio sp. MK-HDV]|jgi:acetyltransferase-like isoleucine patch superfamily enzyme|uniref:DapH/DapD/GlmU-related protein n=1 Tax=Halodesulfovibrio sp. MK-HDV TaxID=2599925 RepID=UPI0013694B46|nr:DapH/DapD/GlmU-related protein [Halodesulfovibrio sp. MK-HDV]KAF1075597.1 Maltose O-acetyltransferase [Halodesulfovibrio sp. MK-HDV]